MSGLFLGSSKTRMFTLISPHRGRAVGFYFGQMENHRINHSVMQSSMQ